MSMTVSSLSDLQAQVHDWVLHGQAGEAARTGRLDEVGAWRLPADVRGDVLVTMNEKPIDRHARQIEVAVQRAGDDGAPKLSGALRFILREQVPVWVAATSLRPGDQADCDLVRQEMRVSRSAVSVWAGGCGELAKLRVKRRLDAGDVLLSSDLAAPAVVMANESAVALITVGAIRIETKAVVLADGRLGQEVPVRLAGQPAVFKARVMGAGEVTVLKGLQ